MMETMIVFMNFKTRIVMASVAVAMVAVIACGTEDDTPAAVATPDLIATTVPSEGIPEPVTREVVDAPIDGAEIQIRESFPVQYAVEVTSGLPNGCYAFNEITVARDGDVININVTNTRPAPSSYPICTDNLRTVTNTETLPGTYAQGTTYTVNVNDKLLTFEGQDPIAVTQTDDRGAIISLDELSDLFRNTDGNASRGDEAYQSFIGFSGEAMTVFGERVEVYVFDSLEDAEAFASGISANGTSIVGPDGSISSVLWIAPPHWYVRGDTIMLYVGKNLDVIDLLDSISYPMTVCDTALKRAVSRAKLSRYPIKLTCVK